MDIYKKYEKRAVDYAENFGTKAAAKARRIISVFKAYHVRFIWYALNCMKTGCYWRGSAKSDILDCLVPEVGSIDKQVMGDRLKFMNFDIALFEEKCKWHSDKDARDKKEHEENEKQAEKNQKKREAMIKEKTEKYLKVISWIENSQTWVLSDDEREFLAWAKRCIERPQNF